MNFVQFNYTFKTIIGVILIFILLLAKGQLLLNEEFLLIINFFLLLGFFYQYVADILRGFLTSKRELIKNEAHRVLSMHRHNATRLKDAYQSKRFTALIVVSSSIRLYRLYRLYQLMVLPRLLPFYLNHAFTLAVETLYVDELQLLRSIYISKAFVIKDRLVQVISSQIEILSSLDRSLAVLQDSTRA